MNLLVTISWCLLQQVGGAAERAGVADGEMVVGSCMGDPFTEASALGPEYEVGGHVWSSCHSPKDRGRKGSSWLDSLGMVGALLLVVWQRFYKDSFFMGTQGRFLGEGSGAAAGVLVALSWWASE